MESKDPVFNPGDVVKIIACGCPPFFRVGDLCRITEVALEASERASDETKFGRQFLADFSGLGNPAVEDDGVWYVDEKVLVSIGGTTLQFRHATPAEVRQAQSRESQKLFGLAP